MNISRRFFSVALVIMSLGAASCEECIDPAPGPAGLTGYWLLQEETCGWSGHSTPATMGYTAAIQFGADGNVSFYRNDSLTRTTPYRLVTGSSIYTSTPAELIYYGTNSIPDSYSISHDTLQLSAEAYDGCGSVYVRQQPLLYGSDN